MAQWVRPDQISSAALAMAWAPEPQTRLTVSHAGLDHVAHDQGLDLVGGEAGACQALANRRGAQVRRRHILERTIKGANRGTYGVAQHNVDLAHDGSPAC